MVQNVGFEFDLDLDLLKAAPRFTRDGDPTKTVVARRILAQHANISRLLFLSFKSVTGEQTTMRERGSTERETAETAPTKLRFLPL